MLLSKLHSHGLRNNASAWFKYQSSKLTQYVDCDGISSSIREIETRVPQGSILSPLLFVKSLINLEKIAGWPAVYILPHNVQRNKTKKFMIRWSFRTFNLWNYKLGFWMGTCNKTKKTRALRIMTNSRYNAQTEPLFKKLHLWKVKGIFYVQCLKFWYKIVKRQTTQLFPWYVQI